MADEDMTPEAEAPVVDAPTEEAPEDATDENGTTDDGPVTDPNVSGPPYEQPVKEAEAPVYVAKPSVQGEISSAVMEGVLVELNSESDGSGLGHSATLEAYGLDPEGEKIAEDEPASTEDEG